MGVGYSSLLDVMVGKVLEDEMGEGGVEGGIAEAEMVLKVNETADLLHSGIVRLRAGRDVIES